MTILKLMNTLILCRVLILTATISGAAKPHAEAIPTHVRPDDQQICVMRGQPFVPQETQGLSVVSWNILSQRLMELHQHDYIPPADRPWSVRSQKIYEELITTNADIICLQEVEPDVFETELQPILAAAGYDSCLQQKQGKKRSRQIAVATFWKRTQLSLTGQTVHWRSLTTVLQDKKGRKVAVVNCHLDGNPSKHKDRVMRLQSALQDLVSNHAHHGVIICGDFNCPLQRSACTEYLTHGAIIEGHVIKEFDQIVTEDLSDIPPHPYTLQSVYTIMHDQDPSSCFTFGDKPGHVTAGLDQIWSSNKLACVAKRSFYYSEEHRLSLLKTGLPSASNPSDHIPVGAIFHWEDSVTETLPELQADSPPAIETIPHERPHPLKQSCDREPLVMAMELLESCQFLDQTQREIVDFIISPIEGLPKAGKPSIEVLKKINNRRLKKEALLQSLSLEEQDILKQILKLYKKNKARV